MTGCRHESALRSRRWRRTCGTSTCSPTPATSWPSTLVTAGATTTRSSDHERYLFQKSRRRTRRLGYNLELLWHLTLWIWILCEKPVTVSSVNLWFYVRILFSVAHEMFYSSLKYFHTCTCCSQKSDTNFAFTEVDMFQIHILWFPGPCFYFL